MRIGSKALFQFLSDRGLLHASDEELKAAKKIYRKQYKANWKRNRQKPIRELRPQFSLKEFTTLRAIAFDAGYKHPTKYLKQLALCQVSGSPLIKNPDELRKALQHLGIAISFITQKNNPHAIQEQVTAAEEILLQYVKQ